VLPSDSVYAITLLDIAEAKQSDKQANAFAMVAVPDEGSHRTA